jgi:glycine cleavage system H protein
MSPKDRKYTKSHEWVKIDGTTAKTGITDHAQDALGDITFVELPQAGANLQKGKECGVIESVKAASDIFSPLSGEVQNSNKQLDDTPETINSDPYGDGWLYTITGIKTEELDDLMDADAYDAFLESEQ